MAKITLADGMTIEGTAEELRELAEVFGEVAEEAEDIDLRTKDGAEEEAPQDVREGDYVVFERGGLDNSAGKPYKITEVSTKHQTFNFRDNGDDLRISSIEDDAAKFYRPIEGDPQVGDKILVVDAHLTNGMYDNGDILTVEDFYYRDIIGRYVTEVGEDKPYLQREEFVIIERAERAGEEATEIEVGDIVKAKKDVSNEGDKRYVGWSRAGQGLIKIGSIGEVVGFTDEGVYAKFDRSAEIDTGADVHRFFLANGEFEVIEKAPDLPVPETIEEGDVVRVTGETYYGDFEEGTIAIVSYFDEHKTSGLARVVIETEDDIDRTSAENLELVAKRADRKDLAE